VDRLNKRCYTGIPVTPASGGRPGIAMQQQSIPLAEQQYLAAHPPDPDDPT
jgi:hypothetical protein